MKLRKLFALVLASAMLLGSMSVTASAGETKQLTVNDGTDTNQYLPVYRDMFNCPQHTQFIQPSGTLTAVKGGKISGMTFYMASGETSDAVFTVCVTETDSAVFTDDFVDTTDATQVYSGVFNPVEDKVEITFSAPYEYKGKNLLIDFTMWDLPTTTSASAFYGENTSSASGRTQYGMDTIQNLTFLPKVTFDYSADVYLDLEASATYPDNKTIDQKYTLAQASESYVDTTKVKLEWTISDIAATYASNKIWDPDNLVWKEIKGDIDVSYGGAEFKLTNYSSKAVVANAEFKVQESLKATFDKASFTNNDCIVATPTTRANNTYQASEFTALAETITATLTFKKSAFADLSAVSTATKYGTYTVTIKPEPNE